MSRYLLGFDIGGTFTDFVLLSEETGEFWIHKVLSTPQDPAQGALQGLQTLLNRKNLNVGVLNVAIHGTTLVTNALIEHRGARTALLTTKGFRDILQMGKEQRYDIYDLFLQYPAPLVPRRWRRGIEERLDKNGTVVIPLNLDQVRETVQGFIDQGVESVAVCFLHSYANPQHEKAVESLLQQEFSEISISLSSEIAREIREYNRTSTTCANAYVKPLLNHYVSSLEHALAKGGFKGRFYLMQSAGGVTTPKSGKEYPIRLLESGPAAGALAAAYYGRKLGKLNILSFDMGGTTAKACLIENGIAQVTPDQEAARVHRFKRGSGIMIKSPTIDLIEIGAGGGSIAWVSELNLLKVGPKSAGADPGPACYDLGGVDPTVTDANLILGYLNPEYFLGGEMELNVRAAENALARLAEPLKLSETQLAWGIFSIVNENMASAARIHIVERGRDPRHFSMVAFGGAGPLHACRVGRLVGISEIILPFGAGTSSALGFLVAPVAFDFAQSYPALLDKLDWNRVNSLFAEMEDKGLRELEEAGVSSDQAIVMRTADMRLEGQFHEINVPIPNGLIRPDRLSEVKESFVAEYKRRYTHLFEGTPIMALTWRVRVAGQKPELPSPIHEVGTTKNGSRPLKEWRKAFFIEANEYIDTPVFDRYSLLPEMEFKGPAIFEERESTAVIGPQDEVRVDACQNLIIQLSRSPYAEL